MLKIRVHIKNDNECNDPKVYIDIELPAVPRIGEFLYLGDRIDELEKKARNDLETAKRYYPKWFYGMPKYTNDLKLERLKHLSFTDASIVDSVAYVADEEIVNIEIDG